MATNIHDISEILNQLYRSTDNMTSQIITSLNLDELKVIPIKVTEHYDYEYSLSDAIRNRCKFFESKKKEAIVRNEPVAVLLEWFKGKSGKKREAAKQLRNRFMHLDYDDQVKVMSLFLDESVSYRKWCYNALCEWKDHSFDDKLIELWNKYHENNCAWAMMELLPPEKLLLLADDLYVRNLDDYNDKYKHSKIPPYLCYKLCWKLAEQKEFHIDWDFMREKTSPEYYLRLANRAGRKESEEICSCLLRRIIQKVLEDDWYNSKLNIEKHFGDPGYFLTDIREIKFTIGEIFKMGYHEFVLRFYQWELLNRARFIKELSENNIAIDDKKNVHLFADYTLKVLPIHFENLEPFDILKYRILKDPFRYEEIAEPLLTTTLNNEDFSRKEIIDNPLVKRLSEDLQLEPEDEYSNILYNDMPF